MWVCPGVWSHFNMVQGCGHLSKCECVQGCDHLSKCGCVQGCGHMSICPNVGVPRGVVMCPSVQLWVYLGVWSYVQSVMYLWSCPHVLNGCVRVCLGAWLHVSICGCAFRSSCVNVFADVCLYISKYTQVCQGCVYMSKCRCVWGVSTCPNVGVSGVCLHVQM